MKLNKNTKYHKNFVKFEVKHNAKDLFKNRYTVLNSLSDLYKTQMGTNLLRLVPIHFQQPKLPQMPDYGYFSRLHLTLANYLLPVTF